MGGRSCAKTARAADALPESGREAGCLAILPSALPHNAVPGILRSAQKHLRQAESAARDGILHERPLRGEIQRRPVILLTGRYREAACNGVREVSLAQVRH